MTDEQAYFAWVTGPKGPVRQKWSQEQYRADAYWDHRVIRKHPISRAMFEELTLDQLEKLFPKPNLQN